MGEYDWEHELLTHYQNLRKLVADQIQLVEKGQSERLADIVEQKQIIIDAIDTIGAGTKTLSPQTRAAVRKYIFEILGMEEEIRTKLEKIKNAVQKEMVLLRTENNLQEKYTTFTEHSYFFDESK